MNDAVPPEPTATASRRQPTENVSGSTPQPRQQRGLLRAVASLRRRNFRLFISGQVVSLIGTSMQSIGQAWLVLELTHSAWQLSIVGALQALPLLLLAMFGGIVADRWPKRRILLITQSGAMLQAFLLWALIASGAIQIWHIYVLAVLLGLTTSLDRPTRRAFVVELVGREQLPNAVALNSALANLAAIVGPSIAGIVIAAWSVDILFLVNALSFPAALAGLALIDARRLHSRALGSGSGPIFRSTLHSLREGVTYVRETPSVLLAILSVGLVLLFGSNFNVVLPLFATDILQVGATGLGFLSAASGAGSLAAALWLAWAGKRPTIHRLLVGMLVFGVLEAGFALSRIYLLSLLLMATLRFAETLFAAEAMITLQTVAPDHLRGRVTSVQVLFFDGSLPLGYLLTGWLAGVVGPSEALLIGGCLSLLVTGVTWLWRRPAEKSLSEAAGY